MRHTTETVSGAAAACTTGLPAAPFSLDSQPLALQHASSPYQNKKKHFGGQAFFEDKCKVDLGFPVAFSMLSTFCWTKLWLHGLIPKANSYDFPAKSGATALSCWATDKYVNRDQPAQT